MAITLYEISVPIFIRHLKGLAIVTGKAQELYAAKKWDETTLLTYRFFPDMHEFARQIRSTTTHANTCTATIAGVEAPKFEDDEKSLADLLMRIAKTNAFLDSIKPEQLNGKEDQQVTLKMRTGDQNYKALDLLQNRSMPNFYFHCTTAYDILRHQGLEIGKRHFMGRDD